MRGVAFTFRLKRDSLCRGMSMVTQAGKAGVPDYRFIYTARKRLISIQGFMACTLHAA